MNISYLDKESKVYEQFCSVIQNSVNAASAWLENRGIEYTWNMWIDNHLYRLYLPSKDLLLDFECYPVICQNYNYMRINYNDDIIAILERLFPETTIETQEMEYWKLTQKATNKFLRENGHNAIYDKSVLTIALVKDNIIYQCIVIKRNRVMANVTKRNCAVPYGTYMLLRYLNEMFGFDEISINTNLDNSYMTNLYQLLELPRHKITSKKKIWWNAEKPAWHIDMKRINEYIPVYFTEHITYKYPR